MTGFFPFYGFRTRTSRCVRLQPLQPDVHGRMLGVMSSRYDVPLADLVASAQVPPEDQRTEQPEPPNPGPLSDDAIADRNVLFKAAG